MKPLGSLPEHDIAKTDEDAVVLAKIDLATIMLNRHIKDALINKVSRDNAKVIADYIEAMKTELNPSDKYRSATISTL